MIRLCEMRRLHLVTYENGMRMQELLVAARQREEIPDQLLLLEHPPVVTLGRGGNPAHLLVSPSELRARGARFYETSRGGDITFHGPGQLVGYPILHLGEGNRDVRRYVWKLEEVLIRTVAEFGIRADRVDGRRGIWAGERKIAAIGVRISRWVTSHGFALNLTTDLDWFSLITPCGISEGGVTSIREMTGYPANPENVIPLLTRHFAEVFEWEILERSDPLEIVKVIAHDGRRVLLLERPPSRGGFWQPVTGRIEPGELPETAALRELREETGQEAPLLDLGLRQSFLIEPGSFTDQPWIFSDEHSYAAELAESATIRLNTEEHQDFGWFRFDEAYDRLRWTDDRESLEHLERRLRGRPPAHHAGTISATEMSR